MTRYGDYQTEIYAGGLAGELPAHPVDFPSLERKAAEVLPSWIHSYVAGGAGDEHTQRLNVTEFHRWGLVPRMLNGAHDRDLSVELFGLTLPHPCSCPLSECWVSVPRTSTVTWPRRGPAPAPGCP